MENGLKRSDEVELEITGLAYGGRGVARHAGLVVFVEGAVPGDTVRATVTRARPSYVEARAVDILAASVARVEPRCRHFGACGGCSWQTLAYEEQLAWKQQQVLDCLGHIGGRTGFAVEEPLGAEPLWRYRNKVEFSFAGDESGLVLGFHRPGDWRHILDIDDCLLHSETTNAIRNHVREYAAATGLAAWDQQSGHGFWRHLVLREGANTGEVMVNIVTAPGALPDAGGFAAGLTGRFPAVVSLIHSVSTGRAATAAGHPFTVLAGRDHFFEELGGLRLKVPPSSFLQTNTLMAGRLYRKALEYAALTGGELVYDLFSGIGSIALLLAGSCREVWGVEIGEEAVGQARDNARINGVANARFTAGRVRAVLKEAATGETPDLVVLDPPRAGAGKKELLRIIGLGAPRIVYVSCNPATLAGNAALLGEGGYSLARAGCVDMFPHTAHVEAVALFTKP